MAIQKTEKIWHNGKLIPWDDAQLHVMSHVVNYGSSVFEGIRCYALPGGPAIFRAQEHAQRLLDSAKIYRIDVDFTREEIVAGLAEVVKTNGVWPCYLRPIVLRGYGEAGVNPFNSPTEVYICNYPWGKYLGSDAEQGVDVCVSSWTRIAPNTLPAMAKSGANYMNSQLIKMEAILNGYVEGIALDVNGYVSEGSGENVFIVRNGDVANRAAGQFRAARHYARFGPGHRSRSGYSCGRARYSARTAVYRRRSLLHRHSSGNHSNSFGRQDQRGQRRVRADHQGNSEGIFWDRSRRKTRPVQLADSGPGEQQAASQRVRRFGKLHKAALRGGFYFLFCSDFPRLDFTTNGTMRTTAIP